MFESLIQVLINDRHSFYLLSAYGVFFLGIFWLIFNAYFQYCKIKKQILSIEELKHKRIDQLNKSTKQISTTDEQN